MVAERLQAVTFVVAGEVATSWGLLMHLPVFMRWDGASSALSPFAAVVTLNDGSTASARICGSVTPTSR